MTVFDLSEPYDESNVIFEYPFGKKEHIKLWSSTMYFDDGRVLELTDYHAQDWCEDVYADWSSLPSEKIDITCDGFKIKAIGGQGFVIHFYNEGELGTIHKYLVNCYNIQNGYYSDQLELQVYLNKDKIATVDITGYTSYEE